jgi:hypothetical protein
VVEEAVTLDPRSLIRSFPGLRLLGAVRLAFDLRKLLVAAVGLVLLDGGWSLLHRLSPASAAVTPVMPDLMAPSAIEGAHPVLSWDSLSTLLARLLEPIRLLTVPLLALIEPGCTWGQMIRALLALLWLLVIWTFCGGMISRIAIVQIARRQRPGIRHAVRFAVRNAPSLIMAPLCPLLALASCALVAAGFGVLYRVPALGPVLAGLVLIIPLGLGLVMTLLVAGLVAGWPLLQAATASGADDSLDALSRTFSYLNQRIGPCAAMLVLAALEGMIGLLVMDLLAAGVIRLTAWSLALTAPGGQVSALFGSGDTPVGFAASAAHALWLGVIRLLQHGWIYSFFWTVAALLYLWLRQDVDGTPWTDLGPREWEFSAEVDARGVQIPSQAS